jgi:ribonuclease BN (tRNA processing enzyme)
MKSLNVEDIKLVALGTGHSFTTIHNFTNFMVMVGERKIFIDCPPYLLKMLRHYREKFQDPTIRIENYKELVLTHTHEDHAAGVEELGYMAIRNRPKSPKIYAPQSVHRELWNESLAAGLRWRMSGEEFIAKKYEDYFHPVDLSYDRPTDLDGFSLEIKKVFHMPETFGLKFSFGKYKFGYSSDTGFMPELFKWWSDCQFIIHEVSFSPDIKWHCPLIKLLELPEEVQKKTYLTHYTDDYLDYEIGHMRYLVEGGVYYPFRDKPGPEERL